MNAVLKRGARLQFIDKASSPLSESALPDVYESTPLFTHAPLALTIVNTSHVVIARVSRKLRHAFCFFPVSSQTLLYCCMLSRSSVRIYQRNPSRPSHTLTRVYALTCIQAAAVFRLGRPVREDLELRGHVLRGDPLRTPGLDPLH